ncbi:MAG TPA: YgjV family protein [Candidatus Acidoferrales bacterium]
MTQYIGWIATAVFAFSYFCRTPKSLRLVQAVAALMWVTYGILIHALPVVVANVIVALAAVYSSLVPTRKIPATG